MIFYMGDIMHVFKGQNLNKMYADIFRIIQGQGYDVSARGKLCKELNPATTIIEQPRERWCSSRAGFNPFFSCAEVLWILSGSSDSEMICYYLNNFKQFLDEPWQDFHGAYGARIFKYGYDERSEYDYKPYVNQFEQARIKLSKDKDTRQAVINLWSPWKDNLQQSKDYCCNNMCYLKIRDDKLNWTQVIRSNDAIYGLPQNIFQFTHLQEIMAGMLGIDVGQYVQVSDSLHVYQNDYYKIDDIRPNKNDIYDTWRPSDARMKQKEFDSMIQLGMMIEKGWRNGYALHREFDTGNTYWNSFFNVIRFYNCYKHDPNMCKNVFDHITNEYCVPVEAFAKKKGLW